jgi:hypothetical protein
MEAPQVQLSDKTSIEVRCCKDGKTPYLLIVRQKEDGLVRRLPLFEEIWNGCTRLIPKIQDTIAKGDEASIKLRGVKYMVVSNFNGKTYIGFHTLEPSGEMVKILSINLNTEEWNKLVESEDIINKAMKKVSQGTLKRKRSDEGVDTSEATSEGTNPATNAATNPSTSVDTNVDPFDARPTKRTRRAKRVKPTSLLTPLVIEKAIQYQWRRMEPHDDVIHSTWFFSKEQCIKDGKQRAGFADYIGFEDGHGYGEIAPGVTVLTREVCLPANEDIMRMMLIYLIQEEVSRMTGENCIGCKYDQPSQDDHMSGGCLEEWGTAVSLYLWPAKLMLNKDRLVIATKKVLELLKPGHVWSGATCAEMLLGMPTDQLSDEVSNMETIDDDYKTLFSGVCHQITETNDRD